MRIKLSSGDRSFEAAPDQTLLDAALAAALNLPHSCKGGSCGACRARVLEGEVHYPNGPPLGLSEDEIRAGFVLMCRAVPRSDVHLDTFEIASPEQIAIKRLPARIERVSPLSHDVMGVHLKLPAAEEFRYQAGQYIDIMLSGGRRRSFSIASPPHDVPLELHVRRVAGGEFSERLFHQGAQGALLSIEGPLGQFMYREGERDRPMLLVGGGTGLAPLLSIIKHALHARLDRDMTLFWGVRAEHDLYAHELLLELSRQAARDGRTAFRYVPVLSEDPSGWSGARGLVHQAVIERFATFHHCDVYAAGPPAMIAAVRAEFCARGADPARLYFDSFDYAPDSAARQASSASTKA